MSHTLSIVLFITININSFLIGYLFGRLSRSYGVNNNDSFIKRNQKVSNEHNNISIDNTKFVTDIRTDGMEKKYDTLGDVQKSQESITNSVDKLKNLKR